MTQLDVLRRATALAAAYRILKPPPGLRGVVYGFGARYGLCPLAELSGLTGGGVGAVPRVRLKPAAGFAFSGDKPW